MKKRTIYPEVDSKQVSSEETISERLRREAEEQVRKETLQKEQEINQKINEINASIDERNLEIARISALAKKNEILNRKLEIYSAILEKVLGQKLSDEDLEKMLLVQESGKKVNEERIEPIYHLTEGIKNSGLENIINSALSTKISLSDKR